MKIFLVRHGQSEGNINKAKYFEKLDCDIELTDKGWEQIVSAGDEILKIVDHQNSIRDYPDLYPRYHFNLYHSPYKRAKQSALSLQKRLIFFENNHINVYEESPLIREREWGGLRDIIEMGNKTDDHFNFYYRPVGGESFADCYLRAVVFHQHLVATSKYENNIIVAHGEFNKLYMMYLLGWTVAEFEKYKGPKNGEVFLIDTVTGLSTLTPISLK